MGVSTQATRVSVIVPTRDRPALLREALASIRAIETDALTFEILVGDNGKDAASRAAAEEFGAIYLPVERAGAGAARNAGLKVASGEFIAFLDDDEIAPPTWLAELLRVQRAHSADAVFGPVRTRLASPARDHAAFFDAFFAREIAPIDVPVTATVDGMVIDVPVKVGYSVIQANNFNPGTTVAVIVSDTFGRPWRRAGRRSPVAAGPGRGDAGRPRDGRQGEHRQRLQLRGRRVPAPAQGVLRGRPGDGASRQAGRR